MVRLEWGIDSGIRGVEPTRYVNVRNLDEADLARLHGADDETMLAAITSLSVEQARNLTQRDRDAIREARRNLT